MLDLLLETNLGLFCTEILPLLSLCDIYPLLCIKRCASKIDTLQFWYAFVEENDIPWHVQEFVDQDTGGTSIRGCLDEAMADVAQYVDIVDGVEVLRDPKGLCKCVAATNRIAPYDIIWYGRIVSYGSQ